MKVQEIQNLILEKTGLKTSVKKGTGSQKGYLIIWPQFQNGIYPAWGEDMRNELKELLKEYDREPKPLFCSRDTLTVFGIENDSIKFKREAKPGVITENSKAKQWGSKNSQMRLNKKAAGYAKKRRGKNGDNMVKYW